NGRSTNESWHPRTGGADPPRGHPLRPPERSERAHRQRPSCWTHHAASRPASPTLYAGRQEKVVEIYGAADPPAAPYPFARGSSHGARPSEGQANEGRPGAQVQHSQDRLGRTGTGTVQRRVAETQELVGRPVR